MREIGEDAANVFKYILNKIKDLPYVVFSGTALGLHRDGDLIWSDTDIDFLLPYGEIKAPELSILIGKNEVKYDDGDQVTLRHDGGIIIDFLFYKDDGDVYGLYKPHYYAIPKKHLDNIDIRDTKYGRVRFPSDIEPLLEKKYGSDWTTPKYQQKRVDI